MKIAKRFSGNTSMIYEDKKIKSENEEQEDEEEANGNNDQDEENKDASNSGDEPPEIEYKLTELDRVSWTISKINDECYIVPINSLILTSSKIMQKNKNFSGLTRNEANKLDCYLHFRTPKDPYSISKYRKATALNETEFLDPITNDLPKGIYFFFFIFLYDYFHRSLTAFLFCYYVGCWRLNSKKSGLEVSIKNLLWNGFEFKYQVGDTQYVEGYFGNGIRQNDLVFMI